MNSSDITQLVFLGTGTPNPDPHRQGSAMAVIVNGQPYLVDCGVGIVRQAVKTGLAALAVERLDRVFITHLHSDHTLGLPDLILTPAVTGRTGAINIYGPPGTSDLVSYINQAWSLDKKVRLSGDEPANPKAYETKTHEIDTGPIYKDQNVRISAISVSHGAWKHAFGFRFETPDRVIVFSGDTTYCPALIEAAQGCDILVHEVYSAEGLKGRTPEWQAYHSKYHTSGIDVGRVASQINPQLVLLNHALTMGQPESQVIAEVKSNFTGEVAIASDLDVY